MKIELLDEYVYLKEQVSKYEKRLGELREMILRSQQKSFLTTNGNMITVAEQERSSLNKEKVYSLIELAFKHGLITESEISELETTTKLNIVKVR